MSDIIKDEGKSEQVKSQSNVSIFDNLGGLFSNSYHVFVVRKSERLASALYVITGFLPADEPVRNRLRVCALELITRSSSPQDFTEEAEQFEHRCAEIVTILQTAHYSGLISEMNARLLGEEYAALAGFVRANARQIAERRHVIQKSSVSEPKASASSIRHLERSPLRNSLKSYKSRKDTGSDYLKNRKNTILSIFDSKDSISIKDAVSLIPGVSEKTIQRDLLTLVANGTLIKSGSRRWTTYKKAPKEAVS